MHHIIQFNRSAKVSNTYCIYFQGDPLYEQFWNRVQNQREEIVFNSIQEGLNLLLGEN